MDEDFRELITMWHLDNTQAMFECEYYHNVVIGCAGYVSCKLLVSHAHV